MEIYQYHIPSNEIYGYNPNDSIRVNADCDNLTNIDNDPLFDFKKQACKSQELNQSKSVSKRSNGAYIDARNVHLLQLIHMVSLVLGCIGLALFGFYDSPWILFFLILISLLTFMVVYISHRSPNKSLNFSVSFK